MKFSYLSVCLLLSSFAMLPGFVFAQYPVIPQAVQAKADSVLAVAKQKSDIAWQKALPIIEKEEKAGKPYVPWASKPWDLPQANIPAFPGAEAGGAFSFGRRGGRVIVVARLADSGPRTFRNACEQGGVRIIVFNVAINYSSER